MFSLLIFLDNIRPICLPLHEPLRSADFIGYSPFVAGWGSISFMGPQSNILRDTPVKVIPTGECAKSYKSKFSSQVFDDRIICAGGGGRDACQVSSLALYHLFFIIIAIILFFFSGRFRGSTDGRRKYFANRIHFKKKIY